jgi:CHAT domain-containing protein
VVSSYTPTVAALLHVQAGDSALNRDHAKLALVATEIAYAQHLPRLPSVVTEMEVIRTMAEQANIAVDVGCAHGSASVARVVEVLESTDIAHIACHGSQDDDEALSSGLFLGDGSLTIRHLMELDLEHAFLAFLSACETAKGDSEQPEETVHLAAAMMFSGFKSVVATMWSVKSILIHATLTLCARAMNDADGPRVARLFYERLFAEKVITTDIVPYCLDHAVTELRRSGASPERWATFIHMGA